MQRNDALDIAKAIGILLVILGHCPEIPMMPFRHFIFTFHMPLFFLISGYLYKPKDVKSSLKKDAIYLLSPYFYTCFFIIFISFVGGLLSGDFDEIVYYIEAMFVGSGGIHPCLYFSDPPIIGAIWFLPALYVCKNTYNCLQAYGCREKLFISSVIFIVSTLIGYYLLFLPFSILSGLSAMIFYSIGDALKSVKRIPLPYWFLGFVCWALAFKYSHLYIATPQLDLFFVDVIGATTLSLCVFLISQKMCKFTFLAVPFTSIGRLTLYILCFHTLDIDILCSSTLLARQFGDTPAMIGLWAIVLRVLIPVAAAYIFLWIKTVCQKSK